MTKFFIVVMMLFASTAWADSFQEGVSAYDKGDYTTALKKFKPLAEQGNADAQYNLGIMYRNGRGVSQDYNQAVRWYTMAAEQGLADAQLNLGVMYDNGQGVVQDNKQAVRWYTMAAQNGIPRAQSNLGLMYVNGKGIVQSFVLAHMWFNISAANGVTSAEKYRDIVSDLMTPQQIAEAQQLARDCLATDYKQCN